MTNIYKTHIQDYYLKLKLGFVVLLSLCFFMAYSNAALAEVIKANKGSSFGTGFIVSNEGYIVTAWHVVKDKKNVYVGPITGNKWKKAEVIKLDEKNDLALLKVPPMARTALDLAEWADVPIGLEAYSIGFPIPKVLGLSRKMTQGLVNGDKTESGDEGFFQFSAETQKGNSGGPVFSPDGLVIGVVLRKLDALKVAERSKDLPENVNYAIKSASVIKFLEGTGAGVSVKKINLNTNMRPYEIFKAKSEAVLAILARDPSQIPSSLSMPAVED